MSLESAGVPNTSDLAKLILLLLLLRWRLRLIWLLRLLRLRCSIQFAATIDLNISLHHARWVRLRHSVQQCTPFLSWV